MSTQTRDPTSTIKELAAELVRLAHIVLARDDLGQQKRQEWETFLRHANGVQRAAQRLTSTN